ALRLEQILLNLMSNAIKFTNEGEVVVQVETKNATDNQVTLHFSVRDTGVGISSEHKSKLFNAFTQADTSTTRKFGGTGLGLSISQRLTEMMGGRIWVDKEHVHGSLFHFAVTFDINRETNQQDLRPPEDMEQLRVLVVDDNTSSRNSLWSVLNMFGFSTYCVPSGAEALQSINKALFAKKPFHLMLVDWFMPGLNGIETVELIKQNVTTENLPKIVLLGPVDYQENISAKIETMGVDALISKPVNCSILFDTTMEVFGKEVPKAFRPSRVSVDPAEIINLIGGARVLLVEDKAINRQVAIEVLESVGLIVEIAKNGLEAVQKVCESEYDVVLMDIQMPEMDGHTATKRIRADDRFSQLSIIAMTAHAMTGDREKSLASGMNDHISKPIDKKQLFASLVKWIPVKKRAKPSLPAKKPAIDKSLQLPTELAGIDMVSALERVNQNHKLFRSVLNEFHRDFANSAKEIRSLLEGKRQSDRETAKELAHTIKGMAGNLSAKKLYDVVFELETAIRDNQQARWPVLLDSFENSLDQVIDTIEILQKKEEATIAKESKPENRSTPVDMANVIPLMQKLSTYLEESNFQSQEIFDAIRQQLTGFAEVQPEIEQLAIQIDQLDLEEAIKTFNTLNKKLEQYHLLQKNS
ncbi:MAG: response regulator, partial [Magnetococcales bacterium]|nr:response regulator [Magnetococcales bacterium]